MQTSYRVYQTPLGLNFELYDAKISDEIKIINKIKRKNFVTKTNSSQNTLTVSYSSKTIYGYDVQRKNDALVFEITKPLKINSNKPLKGVKIALDAGHGGNEAGVISGGVKEKDINLEITKELNAILKKRKAKTFLIRNKDKNIGLYERIDKANKEKAEFFISIHQNSLPNQNDYKKRHGTGVYYYNENAFQLAKSVENNLVKTTGFKKDGVFNASFAVIRTPNPVSILVECGYLIHPYERQKLTDKNFQKIVAKGIADGIEEYLKSQIGKD